MGTRREAGIARRKIQPEQEAVVVQSYTAGNSLKALAQEYACTVAAVRKLLIRNGVARRNRGATPIYTRNPAFVRKVLDLWQQGDLSQLQIGQHLGCSQPVVSEILRANGICAGVVRGDRHPFWQGGKTVNGLGYVYVSIPHDHPSASMRLANGYVLEHRLVMAEHLGRPLLPHETVHHVDGDKTHNVIGNLELHSGRHGTGLRLQCADCGSHNVVPVPLVN